jgi:hypothetical protein
MDERERTTIRLVGLAVHGAGFIALVAAILTGGWELGLAGAFAFVVGGAWGWGMVVAAQRQAAEVERAKSAHAAYLERSGFSARFDDAPEHAIAPPPGAVRPDGL